MVEARRQLEVDLLYVSSSGCRSLLWSGCRYPYAVELVTPLVANTSSSGLYPAAYHYMTEAYWDIDLLNTKAVCCGTLSFSVSQELRNTVCT